MSEIIKVEHEDELITATRPAFYVMGVGHGHRDGQRVTTFALNANDILVQEYRDIFGHFIAWASDTGEALHAFKDDIRRLLVDVKTGKSWISQDMNDAHIFFVVHQKPEK